MQPKYVGLKVGNKAHVTIVWFGRQRTEAEIADIRADLAAIEKSCLPITLKFGEWTVLGKPDDIKRGNGKKARVCIVDDAKVDEMLVAFHRKWYHHEKGEAEERKLRQNYHVTVGDLTFEEITAFDTIKCGEFFIK